LIVPQDANTLLIGWADTVQIAVVRNPGSVSASAAVGGAEAAALTAAARQKKRYSDIDFHDFICVS
jgi:hypothetical protein